jgi:hypothetical protein
MTRRSAHPDASGLPPSSEFDGADVLSARNAVSDFAAPPTAGSTVYAVGDYPLEPLVATPQADPPPQLHQIYPRAPRFTAPTLGAASSFAAASDAPPGRRGKSVSHGARSSKRTAFLKLAAKTRRSSRPPQRCLRLVCQRQKLSAPRSTPVSASLRSYYY